MVFSISLFGLLCVSNKLKTHVLPGGSGDFGGLAFLRSANFCNTTKNEGTNRTARQVEANMPEATAMPSDLRALAPAPLASTNGITPRMKTKDVIMIGRKRDCAASMAASMMPLPAARPSRAISTMRMPFFAERAISRTSPICT